jgi:hypothetical protein
LGIEKIGDFKLISQKGKLPLVTTVNVHEQLELKYKKMDVGMLHNLKCFVSFQMFLKHFVTRPGNAYRSQSRECHQAVDNYCQKYSTNINAIRNT